MDWLGGGRCIVTGLLLSQVSEMEEEISEMKEMEAEVRRGVWTDFFYISLVTKSLAAELYHHRARAKNRHCSTCAGRRAERGEHRPAHREHEAREAGSRPRRGEGGSDRGERPASFPPREARGARVADDSEDDSSRSEGKTSDVFQIRKPRASRHRFGRAGFRRRWRANRRTTTTTPEAAPR